MDPVQELEEVWEKQDESNIEDLTRKAISLIRKAREENSVVPIQLYVEIILAANYAYGFGGEDYEATLLFDALQQVIIIGDPKPDKVFRLACTAIGSLLTIMSSDEQSSSRYAPKLLLAFNLSENATRSQILHKASRIISDLLKSATPDLWSIELLSFYITIMSMLKEFDKLSSQDLENIKDKSAMFSSELNENQSKFVDEWKGSWVEKSDYFRFVSLLIFGKHAKEETWREIAALIQAK